MQKCPLYLLFLAHLLACKAPLQNQTLAKISVEFSVVPSSVSVDKCLYGIFKIKNLSQDSITINNDEYNTSFSAAFERQGAGLTKHLPRQLGAGKSYYKSINFSSPKYDSSKDSMHIGLSYACPSLDFSGKQQFILPIAKSQTLKDSHTIDLYKQKNNIGEVVEFLMVPANKQSPYYIEMCKLYLSNIEDGNLFPSSPGVIPFLIDVIDSKEIMEQEREFRLWQLGEYYQQTGFKMETEQAVEKMANFKTMAVELINAYKK